MTVCHGDDFVSSGSAAALDEVDRVVTTHVDTKILPRIGPTAYGGEVTEGKHLGRTIRWSPQGFECESNSKHVEYKVELCGLKLESKGAPTPITKATERGRRDIDDILNTTDAQTFRQAAGTGLYLSIDRPSLQFAMSVVMSGMSERKVVYQLQVVRVARYVPPFSTLFHPFSAFSLLFPTFFTFFHPFFLLFPPFFSFFQPFPPFFTNVTLFTLFSFFPFSLFPFFTGGGGPARVPNLRVCEHLHDGVARTERRATCVQ